MPVYILAAARTPLGAFGGGLKSLNASDLGGCALAETLRRSELPPNRIDEVILGSSLPATSGGNLARSAALASGLCARTPAVTIGCGDASGLKAVVLGAQQIQGGADLVLAGGAESPSSAPYLLPGARWGVRFGEADLLDSLALDRAPVIAEAEALTQRFGLGHATRVAWIEASRRKAREARFRTLPDLAPLTVLHREGPTLIGVDEPPEASPLPLPLSLAAPSDGAAAVLMSAAPRVLPRPPLGRILDWVESSSDSAQSVRELLQRTGLRFDQIDRWEIHEASAAHVLALLSELPEIDPTRVNRGGGALARGNPMGASGAYLLVSLLFSLQAEGHQTGIIVVPTCQGLGISMAITRS